jgi:hypothetical protein
MFVGEEQAVVDAARVVIRVALSADQGARRRQGLPAR